MHAGKVTVSIIVVLGVVFGTGCGEEVTVTEKIRPVLLTEVGRETNTVNRKFPGVVRAQNEVALAFRVPGHLKEFNVRAGQECKAGDVLAELDQRDYQIQAKMARSALRGHRAQLALMKAGARDEDIAKLESSLALAKSAASAAEANFRRYETLYEKGDIGKAAYDAQKNARDAANTQLAQAEKSLEIGRTGARQEDLVIQSANIHGASAQVESAQDAVAYTVLKAPFSGVVAQTYVHSFEEVQATQRVLLLQDLSRLKIDIDVPEDIVVASGQLRDMKIHAEFDALRDRKFPLTLEEINTEADPATRTYRVTLGMEPPKEAMILPGMSATVVVHATLPESKKHKGYYVPIASVMAVEQNKPYVCTVNPKTMTVKKVPVKTGGIQGDTIQIVEGLRKGQKVVSAGADVLDEGQRVKPVDTDENAGGM